ncbi:MAG: response regulator transcription factor [Alsobacter sp.]
MSEIPVLLVEDDRSLRRLLCTGLAPHGYRVVEAATGAQALAAFDEAKPDLVLLDLGLPDTDGLHLIRRWREAGPVPPIIVLSSRGDERGKVTALELGADDYLTKPFGMAELVARMRTALRHAVQQQGASTVIRSGGLVIDLTRRLVTRDGQEVRLSNKEWEILRLLALHAGRILTHRAIMQEVWGPEVDVQYLRVYVRQIRQKIEADPERPACIVTETGIGYRLVATEPMP